MDEHELTTDAGGIAFAQGYGASRWSLFYKNHSTTEGHGGTRTKPGAEKIKTYNREPPSRATARQDEREMARILKEIFLTRTSRNYKGTGM